MIAADSLPPMHPFRDPEDWREMVAKTDASPAIKARAIVLADDAGHEHLAGHQTQTHPWCEECEIRDQNLERVGRGLPPIISTARAMRNLDAVSNGRREIQQWMVDAAEEAHHRGGPLDLPNARPEVRDALMTAVVAIEEAAGARSAVRSRAERYIVRNGGRLPDPNSVPPTQAEPFDLGTLREVLARPADPPMRADGLIPWDASTLLVAQRKTGKTTLVLNYARSLLTGEDFLGRFAVRPIQGSIAFLNYEVSSATLARWAKEHGVPADDLVLVNLRGRRNPLTDPQDRRKLAAELSGRDVEAVIVDPFGRAYTGKSQNDPGEVGAWLVDLDLFVRSEVGATDLVLTAHAGWNAERARGASALEDWADVIVTMTHGAERDDDDRRYLRAIGRDVDLDEDRLDFDPATRTLTLSGAGSRRQAKAARNLDELAVIVERIVYRQPGITVTALESAVREQDDAPAFHKGEVSKAAKLARDRGLLRIEPGGSGRPTKHFSTTSPNPPRTLPTGTPSNLPHPSLIGGGVGGGSGPVDLPTPSNDRQEVPA